MDEYREIDPEIRKANAFIKLVMIAFDLSYPNDSLIDDEKDDKNFCRVKMMDYVHKIAKSKIKRRNEI